MNTPNKLVNIIAQLKLIIVGLLLVVIGNAFQYEFLKIKLDELFTNVGALFLVAGTIEWLFDERARKELVYEIVHSIRGDDRMNRYGIMDCLTNSKDVQEKEEWLNAKTLVIGLHYSTRFMEDYPDLIRNRIKQKKKTVICHVRPNSPATEYLIQSESGLSDIAASIEKMSKLKKQEFGNSEYVELIEHDRVLRYMFIYTELSIWVKFFTNGKGYAIVPAIRIRPTTPLYEFFESDIKNLGALK